MKVNFTSKGATFNEKKKDKAISLLSRLEKFFTKESCCDLTLSKITDGQIKVDARLRHNGDVYLASAEGSDYDVVMTDAYEKLKKQLRREKDKKLADLFA